MGTLLHEMIHAWSDHCDESILDAASSCSDNKQKPLTLAEWLNGLPPTRPPWQSQYLKTNVRWELEVDIQRFCGLVAKASGLQRIERCYLNCIEMCVQLSSSIWTFIVVLSFLGAESVGIILLRIVPPFHVPNPLSIH